MQPLSLIQSVQNSMVKHAYSLKVPKKAKEAEDFLCEGFHLVQEAQASGLRIRFIFATKAGWNNPEGNKIFQQARRDKVRCFEVTSKIVTYLADTVTPQGILAVAAKPLPNWPTAPFSTVLGVYQVQDPGNMGTLFRSAEAFGVQAIFLSDGCCDPFNPKAVRASMGSLFRLPFMYSENWKGIMSWSATNGFHSYALTHPAKAKLPEVNFLTPRCIWVGTEGAGLPDELIEECDESVAIPMAGKVQSLNVSVAASLALFWAGLRWPVS